MGFLFFVFVFALIQTVTVQIAKDYQKFILSNKGYIF